MANITMEIIEENRPDFAEVEAFIDGCKNGSLYHRPRFLSYHSAAKFPLPQYRWRHYLFRKGQRPLAFLPGALVEAPGEPLAFKSPLGASYGGMVHGSLSFHEMEECVELWWKDLVDRSVRQAEIILSPKPYQEMEVTEEFEFELYRRGFQVDSPGLVLITQVENHPDFPLNLLKRRARKFLNQANNFGVNAGCSEDFSAALDLFYPILAENRQQFDATPTHTQKEIQVLRDLFEENIQLFLCHHNDSVISGALVFRVNQETLNTFYIADLPASREVRGANALIASVYHWARDLKIKWLDFGPSTFGLEPKSTLIEFKESLGGRGFLKRRFCWTEGQK
ncbi:MAG: GNAT family N-acetyltransferase [Nitrospinota bacterium]|nr:GNAT family N-acetyltransferase [Nitrospinota bacterium]